MPLMQRASVSECQRLNPATLRQHNQLTRGLHQCNTRRNRLATEVAAAPKQRHHALRSWHYTAQYPLQQQQQQLHAFHLTHQHEL